MIIFWTAAIVYLINIPFGIWREKEKRFSLNWFLAIHIPVAIAILLRYLWNIEFQWEAIAVFVAVFIAGQTTGKYIYILKKNHKI